MWESVSPTHASTSLPSTTPPDWLPARLPRRWALSLEIDCVSATGLENRAARQEIGKLGSRETPDHCGQSGSVSMCEHNTVESSSKSAIKVYTSWPWLNVCKEQTCTRAQFLSHASLALSQRLTTHSRACAHLDRCSMSEAKGPPPPAS